jgi:hypothetical protein
MNSLMEKDDRNFGNGWLGQFPFLKTFFHLIGQLTMGEQPWI